MAVHFELLIGPVLVLLLLTENGSSAFRHSIQFSSRPTSGWHAVVNGEYHSDENINNWFAEPQYNSGSSNSANGGTNENPSFPFFATSSKDVNDGEKEVVVNNGASSSASSFHETLNGSVVNNGEKKSTLTDANGAKADESSVVVDVVLFGVGDLRVDDHLGLLRAIENVNDSSSTKNTASSSSSSSSSSSVVVPLVLLEPRQMAQIPGAAAHTADTAQLLAAALKDLDASLKEQLDLNLVVEWVHDGHTETETTSTTAMKEESDEEGEATSSWEDVIVQTVQKQQLAAAGQIGDKRIIQEIRVHVCDLGTVDNEMGYGAYSKFLPQNQPSSGSSSTSSSIEDSSSSSFSSIPISIVPWHQNLRQEPWDELETLPDQYPQYEAKYAAAASFTSDDSQQQQQQQQQGGPIKPFDMSSVFFDASQRAYVSEIKDNLIPKCQEIQQAMQEQLGMDPARAKAEERSGLYATHWGGLDHQTVGSRHVFDTLTAYTVDCQEDDVKWDRHPAYIDRHCKRNGRSLEHAAMTWQLRGDGRSSPGGNSDNWLAGESMVRFLAAPLLLGTISPRRIWHASASQTIKRHRFWFTSPLQNLVEGREWHRLLAARNIRLQRQQQQQQCQSGTSSGSSISTEYKYWRYHGFLCRYAQTELERSRAFETAASSKEGILLLHGFGASCAQWDKVMQELASELQTTATATRSTGKSVASQEGLAPDMLGFGHSEKPAISYTGYLWDAMMVDFIKDVCLPKHGWKSYVAGGNSIGGFTSMSMAASDMATISGKEVSSSGAPGTKLCTGLLLMNTAGPVVSSDQVKPNQESAAQALARDGLPPCQPPPRSLSRMFGHAMMAYLRPRIGSICKNLYPTNPDAVDAKLCETIHRDSLDPGAIHVMIAGSKLPPARTANEMLGAHFGGAPADTHGSLPESTFSGPVLVAQGILDPLFNAKSRMDRYGALRPGIETVALNAGHCPHDELPSHVAQSVAAWLSRSCTARRALLTETVLNENREHAKKEEMMVLPVPLSSLALEPIGATNMTLAAH